MTTSRQNRSDSFLYTTDRDVDQTRKLLERARKIKNQFSEKGQFPRALKRKQIALLFSEASTRTKLSFQMAAQRMGGQCLVVDSVGSSSMSKGESFSDTFWTFHAMRPDLFVIRCGIGGELEELAKKSEIPIINAGYGHMAHPTQALLDVMSIEEHRVSVEKQKILIVGDVSHSRVAASLLSLCGELNAEIGICAPKEFLPEENDKWIRFDDLDDALKWATVYYGLRVQFERHSGDLSFSPEDFIEKFRLDKKRLEILSTTALIMHPGPVNWGTEFSDVVKKDNRLIMWQQKENGVYLRAALMESYFESEKS